MNWYYYKKIGLDIPRFWRNIASLMPSMVIPTAVAVLIAVFVHTVSYLTVFVFGCIFLVIYCFFLWHFGMNRYEKNLIREPLRRIFGGRRGKRSM
jgi:hypothetical protein